MSMLRSLACAALLAAIPCAARGATCSFSTPGLAFGAYDPRSTVATRAVGTVQYTCSSSTWAYLAFSGGSSGDVNARQMVGPSDRLSYNLYKDAATTSVWGETFGTALVTQLGTSGSIPVYGSIPPRLDVAAGTYADTLTLTIFFL
jgi:spore coat protein U-like protein